jgi:RNA polymerase sigma-70 factor (ECF subfamily)
MNDQPQVRLTDIESAYRQSFQRFLHVATAIVGDADRAADSVQEAFARAIRLRHTYRGTGELDGWLWRIVVNSARDEAARRRHSEYAESDAAGAGPVPADRAEVRDALARLPERQRLVLFLRYFADLDYAAIATALDISSGTVGATVHKAHAALRAQIQEVRSP